MANIYWLRHFEQAEVVLHQCIPDFMYTVLRVQHFCVLFNSLFYLTCDQNVKRTLHSMCCGFVSQNHLITLPWPLHSPITSVAPCHNMSLCLMLQLSCKEFQYCFFNMTYTYQTRKNRPACLKYHLASGKMTCLVAIFSIIYFLILCMSIQ